jgi:hypothetical protein
MLRTRTTLNGTQGSPYVMTHYFEGSGGTAASAAAAAVVAFMNALDAGITDQLVWEVESEVTELTEAGLIVASHTTAGGTGVGAAASEPLPIASQGLIQWRTGTYLGGREIRGRTFVPGLTSGANDDGRVAASTVTFLEGAGELLLAQPVVPVVWSRKHQNSIPISGVTVWSQFAMLTSRRD